MPSIERLRVGVVGASPGRRWGTVAHLPALLALPEFELVAVATTRDESAKATADTFGIPLSFGDAQQLIEHPDVDVVALPVKVPDHDQLIRSALRAGKHVYSEWPLAVNAAQGTALAQLADQSKDVRHIVGLQGVFAPGALFVRDLIAEGRIGEVLALSLISRGGPSGRRIPQASRYALDPSAGATVLSISTGHVLKTLAGMVGPLSEVSAVVARVNRETTIEETDEIVEVLSPTQILVTGRLAAGAVVSLAIQGELPAVLPGFDLRIVGTDATLTIRPIGPHVLQIAPWDVELARTSDGAIEKLPVPDHYSGLPEGVPAGPPQSVARVSRELGRAIAENRPASPNFTDAASHLELLEVIQRSSDTGTRQTVT